MRRTILLCLWSVGLLLLSLELAMLLSSALWWADMLTPFRLQCLILGGAGMAAALISRDRGLMGLATVVLCLNLVPIIDRLAIRKSLPASTSLAVQNLSILSTNVLCDNRQFDKVVALARHENADVVVAIETTPAWIDHLDSLKAAYPYSFAPRDLGIFGVSIYARQPFQARLMRIGRHRMPLARLEFAGYVLYAVHTMPPARAGLAADNQLYIEELARQAGHESKPVVLAGDFNATLWSNALKPLIRDGWQWPHGSGLAYTWPTDRPYLGIQIDQILTHGAVAARFHVLPAVGSDHFPVRADIKWPIGIGNGGR